MAGRREDSRLRTGQARACVAGAALALAAALGGCGFEPLYATRESASAPALLAVNLTSVKASDIARPYVERAMARRTYQGEGRADFDLELDVVEQAQPLAVQIDDAVTRYNYRLTATYKLFPRDGGKPMTGQAEAFASFNVVASQYSTLYAEDAARSKAARALAEDIERDILLKLAAREGPEGERAAARALKP